MSDLKTEQAKLFSQLADLYFVVFGKSLEHGRTRVGEWLQEHKPPLVIEVGVGTGLTFRHYPQDTHLFGIDINTPMVERAAQKSKEFPSLKIDLQVMDATHMSFPNDHFDCVYSPSVMSVVHDSTAVFKEMIRVCKPGGHILVVCYARGNTWLDRWSANWMSPISEKFLGFHMRLEADFFNRFPELELLEKENVNFFGPWPLSTLFILKKK